MSNTLDATLSELASKFGTSVEYIWPKLVGYTCSQAIGSLIISVIVIALSIILFVYLWKKHTKDEYGDSEPLIYLGYVVCAVVCIVSVICVADAIITLFNPEAATIRSFLGK